MAPPPVAAPAAPAVVKEEPKANYVHAGTLTADQVVDGDANRYAHLDDKIVEVTTWVQQQLVAANRADEIEKSRKDPELRAVLTQDIDRLALQYVLKERLVRGEEGQVLVASVINEILGLGPLEPLWLDPNITEVIANGPEDIYVERKGRLVKAKACRFRSQAHLLEVCQRILAPINRKVDTKDPLADGRLNDGSRVNVVHTSLAPKGPLLTIRRFPEKTFTLVDLVNFGAMDQQMAIVVASLVSQKASTLVVGGTGSGKRLGVNTPVPTPDGWTTMGDLKVGDQVLGRDGRPCNVVFVSETEQHPDLYRITFSDGQQVLADAEHQWVVSDFDDRRRPRRDSKRDASIARFAELSALQERLHVLADEAGDQWLTAAEIADLLHDTEVPWSGTDGLYWALYDAKCPNELRRIRSTVTRKASKMQQPVRQYHVHGMLDAWSAHWQRQVSAENNVHRNHARLVAAITLKAHVGADAYTSVTSAIQALTLLDAEVGTLNASALYAPLKKADVAHRMEIELKHRAQAEEHHMTTVAYYPVAVALRLLAERLTQRYAVAPEDIRDEQVLTTQDMLDRGIHLAGGHAQFAVRVCEPVAGVETPLPVDPYVLGAWLGDGTRKTGNITGIDQEILAEIERAGFQITHRKGSHKEHHILGLTHLLRQAGTFEDKRIPLAYQRASLEQRLALLQGLMDTDGTISAAGTCELSLNKADLAADALSLIRSLGIKASVSVGESAYMAVDEASGEQYRKVTGQRTRIKFTTTLPVFRLPRKLARIPAEVRETQQWLYITGIEPVPAEPALCIQVDSPDSTYLAQDFIPTHNTTLLNGLSAMIPRHERVITIEDALELRLHPESHVAAMEARPPDSKGQNAVPIRSLVKNSLRMRPDRIIVGEIRDAAALDMLQACNTGHEGSMSTVHANGPDEAISRLTVMVAQGGEIPADKVEWLIGSAIDLILIARRYEDGSRRVAGLYEVPDVASMAPGTPLKTIPLWEWEPIGADENGKMQGRYVERNKPSEALTKARGLDLTPMLTWDEIVERSKMPEKKKA